MEEQSLEFRDYLDMLRRRRGTIALVAIVIVVVGIAAALLWPPTYQSTATILIEEQEIPQDLVQSTVTSYANQRIQTIQQRVMTRANLLRIIDKYNLYADERKHDTTEEILDEMQDDIGLNMISADVVDPRTGRPTTATIAFTVSFQGENPSVVQQVDNELASLYLSENQKTRTEKASDTYKFLTGEAKRVSDHIADVESQLAAFKEKHVNELPDLQQLNLQMMERTQRDLDDTENRINTTGDRISYLQAQLQQTKPYSPTYSDSGQRVLDPESQLRALETQYLTMAAKYSPEHPDVVRLRREIAGLKKQVGSVDATNDERQQLDSLEGKLAAAREKYSENYPEVVALKKQVAALKKSIKDSPNGDSKGSASKDAGPVSGPEVKDPQNPAYITLQAQLESAKGDLADLKAKRKDLDAKLADYKKRLSAMPQVERRYQELTRERDTALAKYKDIKAKQMSAQLGQQMEQDRKGERFSLIDPPALPEDPVSPNRPAIIFLSMVLGLGGGFGTAFAAESLDASVRGVRGVVNLLEVPPLATIPYRENTRDRRRRRRRRWLLVLGVILTIIAGLAIINYFWMPLDVLWFKVLRKFDILTGN